MIVKFVNIEQEQAAHVCEKINAIPPKYAHVNEIERATIKGHCTHKYATLYSCAHVSMLHTAHTIV